jgi:hypothetical protein
LNNLNKEQIKEIEDDYRNRKDFNSFISRIRIEKGDYNCNNISSYNKSTTGNDARLDIQTLQRKSYNNATPKHRRTSTDIQTLQRKSYNIISNSDSRSNIETGEINFFKTSLGKVRGFVYKGNCPFNRLISTNFHKCKATKLE